MLSASGTKLLAICVLAGMGACVLLYLAILLRRLPFTPLQNCLYALNLVMARVLWRARVSGSLALPADQGAVIVCNHRSPVDPSFLYLATRRAVHWMVAKEYWRHPALAWFFRTCEAIPVRRGGIDTGAAKAAIRLARGGGLVGLFPEGRINTTDRVLLPGRAGAALIALKARVPIVPCYLSGSPYDGTTWGCLFMPAKVRLEIGPPIDFSELHGRESQREALEELTKRLLSEIARLAGHEDFQPELAGRFSKPSLTDAAG